MDTFLTAQIIGFTALTIGVLAFQIKKQTPMFIILELSNIIWCIHYSLLNGYTAAAVMIIGVIRTIIVLYKPKFKLQAIVCGLCVVFIACLLSPETYWYKYLPFIAGILYSTALFFNNDFIKSRLITAMTMCAWLVYGIMIKSIPEITESTFMIVSIFIGLLRHRDKVKQPV